VQDPSSLHLPLNRQSATYAREGIDLEVSRLGGRGGSNPDAAGDGDPDACLRG
jgi:hypothetical protein